MPVLTITLCSPTRYCVISIKKKKSYFLQAKWKISFKITSAVLLQDTVALGEV